MKVAVCTTMYPGAETYLSDWYHSLKAQTDRDYQLWVGLDGITPEAVERIVGDRLEAAWIISEPGDTPAQIRQRTFSQLIEVCEAVVLVDSDDVLHKDRVSSARETMAVSELSGCALRLIDEEGHDLGVTFDLPPETKGEDVLPQRNVFGLSNSTYRSDLLRRCLPIPRGVVLVDWFLATKAWLMGARLAFDSVARMDYRQHSTNTARIRFPLSQERVVQDTEMVRQHFRHILAEDSAGFLPTRWAEVSRVASNVEAFRERIVKKPTHLLRYVDSWNALNPTPIWWSSVAYPALEGMWLSQAPSDYEHD